ncbi:MAG: YkgJ family cysteine cluster protein [Fusobacterium sp.]|nr:YkgJ family cysteine cluster protein [Fusobacterium sp.]
MYERFLKEFAEKLAAYFEHDAAAIKCKKGCTFCCENADYPLSRLEMEYLMKGFLRLDKEKHDLVRERIRKITAKPYPCPFLLEGECSVYSYRPLTCRVHGLAYMRSDGIVKLPECARQGLNYSENFDGKTINFEPIKEDLNLDKIFAAHPEFDFGEIRSMIDWFL